MLHILFVERLVAKKSAFHALPLNSKVPKMHDAAHFQKSVPCSTDVNRHHRKCDFSILEKSHYCDWGLKAATPELLAIILTVGWELPAGVSGGWA